MAKARSTKTIFAQADHELFPAADMETVEEIGPQIVVDENDAFEGSDPRSEFLRSLALEAEAEDEDGANILREMAGDLEDLRGLAQTMASLRTAFSEARDRRGPPSEDMEWQTILPSWLDDDANPHSAGVPSHIDSSAENDADQISEKAIDWEDVMVELRMEGLLEKPFQEALQACQALRQYIDEQSDPELEKEFEEHWHPKAPEELRHVMRELLQGEAAIVEVGVAEEHGGRRLPNILAAPVRSRL